MELTRDILREELQSLKRDVVKVVEEAVEASEYRLRQEIHDSAKNTKDLLVQEIKASEARTDIKLEAMEERILTGVAEILDERILPQIDNHERRIIGLEAKAA